jgi:hypothetical protein
MYKYVPVDEGVRKSPFKERISKSENNLLIAVGIMWVNMLHKKFGLEPQEIPQRNLVLIIRRAWERSNKKMTYDNFKDLFTYFLNSTLKDEDKISFDLCLSEKYMAKWKMVDKKKVVTNVSMSQEVKL